MQAVGSGECFWGPEEQPGTAWKDWPDAESRTTAALIEGGLTMCRQKTARHFTCSFLFYPHVNLRSIKHYYPQCTDSETEAQKGSPS